MGIGVALANNHASSNRKRFLDAGGLGVLTDGCHTLAMNSLLRLFIISLLQRTFTSRLIFS
jgi:hypothetical protein